MPPTKTLASPPASTVVQTPATNGVARADLPFDLIVTQLRGTFDGKLEQMLALPADDPACNAYAAALDDVNAALARVHDGTFGICVRCDGPISVARLEVVPTTTVCISCKAMEPGAPL